MKITDADTSYKIKLKSFYRKTIHSDFFMKPHSHKYVEIMNIISGECFLDIYENNKIGETIKLSPNTIVVISSDKYHCIRTNQDVTLQNLEFETSLYRGEQFLNTMDLVKCAHITHLHVFPYSERPGTVAAKMEQVPKNIRKERAQRLRKLGEELHTKLLKQTVGKKVSVLVEENNSGWTENYLRVILSQSAPVGHIVSVKIQGVKDRALVG